MQIAFLNLIPDPDFNDPEAFIKSPALPDKLIQELIQTHSLTINIVQRSSFNTKKTANNISYYFVSDEFESVLRWWQEPAPVLQLLSELMPDIVHFLLLGRRLTDGGHPRKIG